MQDDPQNPNDLKSILAAEEQQNAPQNVDPAALQEKAQQRTIAAKKDSPYVDQQLKPGQVIGYGIPTNQNVQIPIAEGKPGLSKKTKRRMLFALIAIIVLGVLGGISLLARKVAISS